MKHKLITIILIVLMGCPQALEVEIISPSDNATIHGPYTHLKAIARNGNPPYTFLWMIDGDRMFPSSHEWEPPECKSAWLSIGKHIIGVVCEDSEHARATDSVTVNVERPELHVSIVSPKNGTIYGKISFEANVSGTPPYEYKWISNLDGVIGNSKKFSREISAGEHEITLKVIDSLALVDYDRIRIDVREAPRVNIISPENGSYYGDITFKARITGGKPPYDIKWFSDGELIGNSESFTKRLSKGKHTIQLQVTDSQGTTVKRTVSISTGSTIDAEIVLPREGNYWGEIEFRASIAGGTPPYDVSWTSSTDGFLSEETNFTQSLSEGKHTIILEIVDSEGQKVVKMRNISVISPYHLLYYAFLGLIVLIVTIVILRVKGRI